MLRSTFTLALLIALTLAFSYQAKAATNSDTPCPHWLDVTMDKLHSSQTVALCEKVAGHPVLIINTASHCGYTEQFSGLEQLHQEYHSKGLVVIGFPSDSFNQEANSEAETASVCYKNFGVTFLMSKPVNVRGKSAHPIFKHLGDQKGEPTWNFNKYLVNPQGDVVQRYESSVSPNSPVLKDDLRKQFSL